MEDYAKAEMLIRKPVQEVFEAFINPKITENFWFTKSSGSLKEGKTVEWTWEMYNVSTSVTVLSIIQNHTIKVAWGDKDEQTEVEWTFTAMNGHTFVSIINRGFQGSKEEIIAQVRDSTGGFSFVLSGLKAYLEHGIHLGLIEDHAPSNQKL